MKKRFWLTYDLGIDGDYDGLYALLDELEAVECGDSACSFELDPRKKEPPAAVLAEVRRHAKLRTKDRIYLLWRKNDGSITGRFIAGKRRRSPWAGYAVESSGESEDAEG
jgi:hypothetical protein